MGIVTIFIIILPFLQYPDALKKMAAVLFSVRIRGFAHPAPTFWFFIGDFNISWVSQNIHEEKNRDPMIPLPFIIQLITALYFFRLMLKTGKKKLLLSCFTVYSFMTFLFGYSMHEKHLHYAFLTLVLQPGLFKDILPYFLVGSVISLAPAGCTLELMYYLLPYGFIMSYAAWIGCEYLQKLDSSEQNKPAEIKSLITKLYYFGKTHRQILFTIIATTAAVTLTGFIDAMEVYNYKCLYRRMIESHVHKCGFILLFCGIIWLWTIAIQKASEKKNNKVKNDYDLVESKE